MKYRKITEKTKRISSNKRVGMVFACERKKDVFTKQNIIADSYNDHYRVSQRYKKTGNTDKRAKNEKDSL